MRYDFRCPICDRVEEATDRDAKLYCEHVGLGEPSPWNDNPDLVLMKRVYGTIGVSFKGSGFYKTDSQKDR